ncbi:MAG: ribonuclease HII [Candidatus Parcubacteria bacterium]|nr:MAG: ribonuclease HII [Candidatus Parcubacteria bacterium]
MEKKLIRKHKSLVAIDEAGRGALAGPLTVAGLYLDKDSLKILTKNKILFFDSKILKPEEREILRKIIKKNGLKYKIVSISNKKIDKIGINQAFVYGVKKIIGYFKPEAIVLDGKAIKELNYKNIYFFIKGDRRLASLGGASILAKTHRDDYMKKIAQKFPKYLFEIHKGYGTKKHYQLIKKYGLSSLHRKSFVKFG